MIIISPSEFRAEQKKYLDLVESEEVIVKRADKFIRLLATDRTISDADLRRGIEGDELLNRLKPRIKRLFDK